MKRLGIIAAGGLAVIGIAVWFFSGLGGEQKTRDGRTLSPEERRAALAEMARKAAEEIDPVRPAEPPDPDHYVAPKGGLPTPEPPPDAPKIRAGALAKAIAENAERPGDIAFRTMVSAFVRHNEKFADAQARREGLTLEEVEELTYFGLMVQETQRWGEVEQLVGAQIPADKREQGEALMYSFNGEFKEHMRKLVADGASAEERWKYIQETQERYRAAYFALTGMNAELLDDLLAGDASRNYAVSMTTPPPEGAPSEQESDTPRERPETPPPPDDAAH